MTVRASTRISIRWPPAEASEPTDTLVLSIGDYYVDLRVLKSDQSIEWALAGQRLIISENPLKVKFTHPLDSHYVAGEEEGEPDIGEFTKLPNGDDLEEGVMAAPHLDGKIMPYQEIWRELDPGVVSTDGDGGDGKACSWILESIDQPSTVEATTTSKSYYAKGGKYFLALRQVQTTSPPSISVSAIRQDWDSEKLAWSTKYTIGNVDGMVNLSSEAIVDGGWKVGDEVKVGSGGERCIVRSLA